MFNFIALINQQKLPEKIGDQWKWAHLQALDGIKFGELLQRESVLFASHVSAFDGSPLFPVQLNFDRSSNSGN